MSIIDNIESITMSRNTIRTKMVAAGQATRNDKLATLATNLSITDTSDATATAADIAEGKTAYVEGVKITGTSTKDSDTSDATATAADIAQSKTAYVNGSKITGTSTKDADTSDATATAGDILSGATAYVNGSKLVGTIQSKAAQTYTPGAAAQTIVAGQYLAGTQTIQGSSALTADNIKQGTSIFGITGTFSSDATATAEDIAEGKTAYVNGNKLIGTASSTNLDDYNYYLPAGIGYARTHVCYNSLFNVISIISKRNGVFERWFDKDDEDEVPQWFFIEAAIPDTTNNFFSDDGVITTNYSNFQIIPGSSNKIYHYKGGTIDTWSQPYPTLPYNFVNGAIVYYESQFHIIGGTNMPTKHYKYDNNQWVSVSTLPVAMSNAYAIVHKGKIHVIGYSNSNGNSYYVFGGSTWTRKTATSGYENGTIVSHNNEIYLVYGDELKKYNDNSDDWEVVSTLPYYAYRTAAFSINNKLHIFGGGTSSNTYRCHYIWDETSNKWEHEKFYKQKFDS